MIIFLNNTFDLLHFMAHMCQLFGYIICQFYIDISKYIVIYVHFSVKYYFLSNIGFNHPIRNFTCAMVKRPAAPPKTPKPKKQKTEEEPEQKEESTPPPGQADIASQDSLTQELEKIDWGNKDDTGEATEKTDTKGTGMKQPAQAKNKAKAKPKQKGVKPLKRPAAKAKSKGKDKDNVQPEAKRKTEDLRDKAAKWRKGVQPEDPEGECHFEFLFSK